MCIRQDIPSRHLHSKPKICIETISVKINLRKRKWFFNCSYNPNKNHILNPLKCLNRTINEFSNNYDNPIFLGNFNTYINDNAMMSFCSSNDLTSLSDQPTCYKNSDKPTCIDLILTNHPNYFQQNNVFETGLSIFHMILVTEYKWDFKNLNLTFWLTVIINALIMKTFQQTFKVVLQKKNLNSLKKLFFSF